MIILRLHTSGGRLDKCAICKNILAITVDRKNVVSPFFDSDTITITILMIIHFVTTKLVIHGVSSRSVYKYL